MTAPGKALLVTGGSRGIGAAVCRLAAKAGYRVAVNYASNEAAAAALVAEIQAGGGEAFAIKGDVGNEADVVAMFAAVDRTFGGLDAFVNNAGVVDRKARVDEMSVENKKTMMKAHAIPGMRRRSLTARTCVAASAGLSEPPRTSSSLTKKSTMTMGMRASR